MPEPLRKRSDKRRSFTDYTNFVIMSQLRFRKALAFEKNIFMAYDLKTLRF